jgi:hypothetical protein
MGTSHLVAIIDRLEREINRLKSAKTSREAEFRARQIAQAEKELEDEYKFLGMTPTSELPEISADDLLAELSS